MDAKEIAGELYAAFNRCGADAYERLCLSASDGGIAFEAAIDRLLVPCVMQQTNDYSTAISQLRERIKQDVIEAIGGEDADGAREGMEAMAAIDSLLGMPAVKALVIPF